MMKKIAKYYIKKIFAEFYSLNIKLYFLIAVLSFCTAYNLEGINTCSIFEYVLLGMSEQYYFVFFFLIIYILTVSKFLKDSNAMFIVRSDKYSQYFAGKMLATILFTISTVAFHVVIISCCGILKHKWNNSFVSSLGVSGYLEEVHILYQKFFNSPLTALIAVCLYMSLGLCIMAGLFMLLSHFFSDKLVLLSEIIVFFLIVLALQRNIDICMPKLFLINYMFLQRILNYVNPVSFLWVGLLVLISFFFLARLKKRSILRTVKKIFLPIKIMGEMLSYKNIFIFIVALLVLTALSILDLNGGSNTYFKSCNQLFWGYGTGYFHVMDFLKLIIMNGLSVYILCVFLENKFSMRNIVMIRYQKRREWFKRLQLSMLLLIIIQLAIMCLFAFGLKFIESLFQKGQTIYLWNYLESNLYINGLIIGFLLRVFEIMFLQMSFLVFRSFWGNSTIIAFGTVMAMYFTAVFFRFQYFPFGLSSLCRFFDMSNREQAVHCIWVASIFISGYNIMYLYMVRNKKPFIQ